MTLQTKYRQFLRFCINGCLAVAIQYAVYLLLIRWINEYAANTVGYAVSFCCNFIITSYWTFGSKPSWKRLAGFSGSHIVNYLVQQIFLFVYLTAGIASEWAALLAMGSAVSYEHLFLRHVIYFGQSYGDDTFLPFVVDACVETECLGVEITYCLYDFF